MEQISHLATITLNISRELESVFAENVDITDSPKLAYAILKNLMAGQY